MVYTIREFITARDVVTVHNLAHLLQQLHRNTSQMRVCKPNFVKNRHPRESLSREAIYFTTMGARTIARS